MISLNVLLTRRSRLVVGGCILVVLLVVGGMVLRGRFRGALARQSIERLSDISSVHARAELGLILPSENTEERPFTDALVRVDGDLVPTETPGFVGTLYAETRGRGTVLFTDGELRVFPDTVAFRLENLPVLFDSAGALVRKWTYVDSPLLVSRDGSVVQQELVELFSNSQYVGKDTRDGRTFYRYTVPVSPEQEEQLAGALRSDASGSPAWDVIARLVRAADVASLDVWIDADSRLLSSIEAAFVLPRGDLDPRRYATLRIQLSDYNKDVALERPPKELTVRPDVFAAAFAGGNFTAQE